ncbi:unnamed protein product, partial [Iphiclides podalirius]
MNVTLIELNALRVQVAATSLMINDSYPQFRNPTPNEFNYCIRIYARQIQGKALFDILGLRQSGRSVNRRRTPASPNRPRLVAAAETLPKSPDAHGANYRSIYATRRVYKENQPLARRDTDVGGEFADMGRGAARTGRFLTLHKRRRRPLLTRSLRRDAALLDDLQLRQVQASCDRSRS